jgi:ABC-type cobalamin transport system ATPase subunit
MNFTISNDNQPHSEKAQNTLFELKGELNSLVKQKVFAIECIQKCNDNINSDPEVTQALNAVANSVQNQGIQLYTKLLTALVVDVMDDSEQSIELESYISRNAAQLDVVSVKHGKKQDIVKSRGGSISNLVATGMRFIELVQSANRRVLFLDEPDCWIQTSIVPRYIAVIAALCDQIGVQCIFISHHTINDVPANCNYVELSKNSKGLISATSHKVINGSTIEKGKINQTQFEDLNNNFGTDVGIRSITLNNVMSHTDTTINLSSGLTWLRGENDLGKSCLNRAMDCMLQNKAYEELVRDGQTIAKVTVEVEDGYKVSWAYNRKPSIKSSYTLFGPDGEIEETVTASKGEVPDFVKHYIAIMPKDGKILNITTQTDPLHLLHPNISSGKRAELINLGCASQKVNKMISTHKDLLAECKRELKRHKETLTIVDSNILKLQSVLPLLEIIEHNNQVSEQSNQVSKIKRLLSQLENNTAQLSNVTDTAEKLKMIMNAQQIERTIDCSKLKKNFETYMLLKNSVQEDVLDVLDKLSFLTRESDNLFKESIDRYQKIKSLGVGIASYNKVSMYESCINSLKSLSSDAVDISEVQKTFTHFASINQLSKGVAHSEQEIGVHRSSLTKLQEEQLALIEKYGEHCSTCGQSVAHLNQHKH